MLCELPARASIQNVLHQVSDDIRSLIRVMLFELLYVVANRVVEYGDSLSPEVFDDTLVLVDR